MKLTKRSLILFAALLASCSTAIKPLAIDPCVVLPHDKKTCRAVPLNQEGKKDYDRPVAGGDICLTASEYAELIKKLHEYARASGKDTE